MVQAVFNVQLIYCFIFRTEAIFVLPDSCTVIIYRDSRFKFYKIGSFNSDNLKEKKRITGKIRQPFLNIKLKSVLSQEAEQNTCCHCRTDNSGHIRAHRVH